MSWVPRLDPTGGIVGLRSRYVPRGTEPVTAAAKPVAPSVVAPTPKPPAAPVAADVFTAPGPDTVRGCVLIALGQITDGRPTPVSVELLTVRAWRFFPHVFGLRGFEKHFPDSNRVLAKLCGASGLIGMGLLRRTKPGTVALTPRGALWWRTVGAPWRATQKAGT